MSGVHDIGWAVKQMWDGEKVRRHGWNGKGMWVAISGEYPFKIVAAENFWSRAGREYAESQQDGHAKVLPTIIMKTAAGEILMGWLASQTDLLARDWEIAA